VTDHRASLTTHNLEQVLDGDIDQFTDALIALEQAAKMEEAGL
jgi:peptide chain release factor 1